MKKFKFYLLSSFLVLFVLGSCTNDDDTTVNCTPEVILGELAECPWLVKNSKEQYIYTFKTDKTLTITGDNVQTTGTWSVETKNDGSSVVTIIEPQGDFNDTWIFTNCDFKNTKVTSTVNKEAVISRKCGTDCSSDVILGELAECPWLVNKPNEKYIYIFKTDKTLTITSDNVQTTGTWSVETKNDGSSVVTIIEAQGDFNDTWIFTNCDFKNTKVTSTVNKEAIISRKCGTDSNCTPEVIFGLLAKCPWLVKTPNEQYIYTFNIDKTLTIKSDNVQTTGTWSVETNNDGLNIVTIQEKLNDFNDEWIFTNCDFKDTKVTSTVNKETIISRKCGTDSNCTPDVIQGELIECPWIVISSNKLYTYTFKTDKTLTIVGENVETTGTWSIGTFIDGISAVTIQEKINDFNDKWIFTNCDFKNTKVLSTVNKEAIISRKCN